MKVAVNPSWTRKFERDNPEFYGFHNGFKNVDISQETLIEHIKAGHSYCAQHAHVKHPYETSSGEVRYTAYRCQQNWLPSGIISLDFDTGDNYSSFSYLLNDLFILQNAAFLYSTTSSTPEKPRTRVVFVADRTIQSPINYYDALCALAARFTRGDKSAKDIVKPYAGNQNAIFNHLGNVLPVNGLARLVFEWKEKEAQEQRAKKAYYDSIPKTATIEEVQEMLNHVPSTGMDYIAWVKMLMAVHDAVPDELGIEMCERWCPGKKNEIASKFKSFRTTEVTVAYLRSQAMRHGWQPTGMSNNDRADMAMRMVIAQQGRRRSY